jgi:hypothetical protein
MDIFPLSNIRVKRQRWIERNAPARHLITLSKGFADLAANARTVKAKELPNLLAPYAAQMQTLIPQIQKAS